MKLRSILLVILIFMFAGTAQAELFTFSVGKPLNFKLENHILNDDPKIIEAKGSPEGYLVGVQAPFLLGLGMEEYTQPVHFNDSGAVSLEMDLDVEMMNVFYQLPLDSINITLGVGTGSMQLVCDGPLCGDPSLYESASVDQFYFQVGGSLFWILDLHLSYHMINGDSMKINEIVIKTKSTMTAVGVSLYF